MARNQFAGLCRDCASPVAAGEGYFHKERGGPRKWSVRCVLCVAKGKQAKGLPLSHHQQAALAAEGRDQ